MLGHAIEQLMNEMSPCDGVPSVLPPYEYEGRLDTSQVQPHNQSDTSLNLEGDSSVIDSSMALDTDMDEG